MNKRTSPPNRWHMMLIRDPVIWYFIFVAGLCKTVTHQIAFLQTNAPPCPLKHTHTHTNTHTPVKADQCECFLSSLTYTHTHTHTHRRERPNPTGQHVRQRSENTFSTWLSNRAARGGPLGCWSLPTLRLPLLLHRRSTASGRWGQPDRDESILCWHGRL